MKGLLCLLKVLLPALFILNVPWSSVYALDPPHDSSAVPPMSCNTCHVGHGAAGANLTTTAGNANLCFSCHVEGGQASGKVLHSNEQAVVGTSGIHHRWDAATPVPSDPALSSRLENGKLMCSTCHNQHSEDRIPFDPAAPGTAGQAGRHFQRLDNDTNYMCRNCHSDKNMTSVRTYTGANLSHPVGVVMPQDSAKFHDAPREPNGSYETGGPRFAGNGTGDTNSTNNLVLDANRQVQCLSCHNVHYADSDPNTVDQ